MAYGDYIKNYEDLGNATAKTDPILDTGKVPWYNNPGVWSKIGAVGAALLPQWNRLKAAGEYASGQHQSNQLNRAQQRMFANVAAGNAPMEGFTDADTMGLTPQQITDLNKTGVERQSALAREGREERQLQNTLETGVVSRNYTSKLAEQIDQELKQTDMFNNYIDDVAKGNIQSKYITPENAQFFKALGGKQSAKVISEIVQEEEKAKRLGRKTEQVNLGNKIMLVDSQTGLPINQWDVGAKPVDKEPKKNTAGLIEKAREESFVDLYPDLMTEIKSKLGGDEAKTMEAMKRIKLMFGDPKTSGAAMMELRTLAPNSAGTFDARMNEVLGAFEKGEGKPPLRKNPIDTTTQDKTKQTPKQLEKIINHKDFKGVVSSAISGKPAGTYDVKISGQVVRVKTDGKGGFDISYGGK